MRIGSLFSGIGGLELGLERAGLGRVVWQVEIDPFCRSVLEHHWPDAGRYEDVRKVGIRNLSKVDLVCGGFPCQDVSQAARGRNEGLSGPQSGLWFQYERIVEEIRPYVVVVENVASGASRWVPSVRGGLRRLGYSTIAYEVPASSCGAPHDRKRIFVVAYADGDRKPALPQHEKVAHLPSNARTLWNGWFSEPRTFRMADGVPGGMDRLRALGNAVVPQAAEAVGRMIREHLEQGLPESRLRPAT